MATLRKSALPPGIGLNNLNSMVIPRTLTSVQIDTIVSEILKGPAPAPHPELTPPPTYSAIWRLPAREVVPYFFSNVNWANTKNFGHELFDRFCNRYAHEKVGAKNGEPTMALLRLFPIFTTTLLLFCVPIKLRYGFNKKPVYD